MKCDLCEHELSEVRCLIKLGIKNNIDGKFLESVRCMEAALSELEGLFNQKGMKYD